jgi:plasmid stabilization system protein ParE
LTRRVTVTRLAERDIAQAQDDYESREPGLGNRFVEQVRSTINRIGQNPFQYQVVPDSFGSRRAPVRRFPWSVWYQVLPDESVVIGCLAHRQDIGIAKRRAMQTPELS